MTVRSILYSFQKMLILTVIGCLCNFKIALAIPLTQPMAYQQNNVSQASATPSTPPPAPTVQAAAERRTFGFDAAQLYPLSLHPPPGDYSIVFLGNIFGSVDGALAGSGSQIIGDMFGVFNSAVLAFGGIVLLYSLIVGTGNTAHEGQFIGQKWSSIWVPMRSFVGVGAIIPVGSGYCLMQILVMTIVVQGVGAADSVWSAALNYLQRGGVIVQKQIKPSSSAGADDGKILSAAMGINAAQVCMIALESKFKAYHEQEVRNASVTGAHCDPDTLQSGSAWDYFCNNPVPSFTDSVNLLSDDNTCPPDSSSACQLVQSMPDFSSDDGNIYASLNGLCGQLSWTSYISSATSDPNLNDQDKFLISNSRTLAINQMYLALLPVSSSMVNNSALFNSDIECISEQCSTDTYSKYDYGYPLSRSRSNCQGRNEGVLYSDSNACVSWGSERQAGVLFNGSELQDAVAAYNGIMLPTLTATLLTQKNKKESYKRATDFIEGARRQGWVMAGAYFFQLALLNNYVEGAAGSNLTDSGSNIAMKSQTNQAWNYNEIKSKLTPSIDNVCVAQLNRLTMLMPFCQLTNSQKDDIGIILGGLNYTHAALPNSSTFMSTAQNNWYSPRDNNAFVYMVNANSIVLPTQTTKLNAGLKSMGPGNFNASTNVPKLGDISTSGGKWGVAGDGIKLLFNAIIKPLWNTILGIMLPFAIDLLTIVISPMISMVGTIFNNALEVMRIEGVNPIIAIANMGTQFIDGVGNSWLAMLIYATIFGMLPAGQGILQAMMPVVTVWMGIMVGVGFTAAFYVPFVPFLVFAFASIGWLISVIESMVAAPIVALGIILPEGHDVFGKSDPAVMLLLNVFLRPSMMIIGYIMGIILSYVGVWVMNSGFNYAMKDIKLLPPISESNFGADLASRPNKSHYGFWSNIFLLYFAVLTYVSTYEAIVIKAFDMIHYMPDKVLRWIADGRQEQFGQGTVEPMLQEVKAQSDKAAKQAAGAMAKTVSTLSKADNDDDDDKDDDDKEEEEESEGEEGKEGEQGADASAEGASGPPGIK